MAKPKASQFRTSFSQNGDDGESANTNPILAKPPPPIEEKIPVAAHHPKIPDAELAPKKRDSHISGPKAVFRGIPVILKKKLDKLSDEVQAPVGYLARYFFEQGLDDLASGRLSIKTELSLRGLTIFPDDERRNGRPPATAKKHGKSPLVSFHGVPSELVDEIRVVAENHSVNIGEVARLLIEHGFDWHQKGRRRVTRDVIVQFVQSIRTPSSYPTRARSKPPF